MNVYNYDKKYSTKSLIGFAIIILTILIFSDSAFASGSGNSDAVGSRLCTFAALLRGNIAKAVATFAIFVVGGGMLMGKINWVSAVSVCVGILVIFMAPNMVLMISGNSGGC